MSINSSMNRRRMFAGATFLILGATAPCALGFDEFRIRPALTCDDAPLWDGTATWQKKVSGVWTNWAVPPGAPDSVYIQNGKCVHITGNGGGSGYHAFANNLYICGAGEGSGSFGECTGGSEPGTINVHADCSSLTVHADSTVNGHIDFIAPPTSGGCSSGVGELRIKKNGQVKFTGNGGKVRSVYGDGLIKADSDVPGELLIDGQTPGDEDTSMTLMSVALDLEVAVKLTNRGDVYAEHGTVTLTTERKSGNSGYWRASSGTLEVDYDTRGGGTWRLEGSDGIIQFDAESTNLSGTFYLPTGHLIANEILCTTGHVVYGGGYIPPITCAPGKKITFHGDCN